MGASASTEKTTFPLDRRNATEFEKISNSITTADPMFSNSGYSNSDYRTRDENQGEGRAKIMSQGVGQVPDEQLLMERLMIGYHKYARPVVNASFTVIVKFGLTLVQISDMVSESFLRRA